MIIQISLRSKSMHEKKLIRFNKEIIVESIIDEVRVRDLKTNNIWNIDLLLQPHLLQLIRFTIEWKYFPVVSDFLMKASKCSTDEAETSILELLYSGIFEVSDNLTTEDAKKDWTRFGWERPLIFHSYTNSLEKLNYGADGGNIDVKEMHVKVKAEQPPSNYKEYDSNYSRIILPSIDSFSCKTDLNQVMRANVAKSTHLSPFSIEELSWYLKMSFGQTDIRRLMVTGEHVAKTSPSGGSRHPTEVYVFIINVEDVPEGFYHYNVKEHSLILLKSGNFLKFFKENLIKHPGRPSFNPCLGFFYTTIFERSMFRYREARSYRVMNIDIGHIMQTSALNASAIGRACYRGYSLNESIVEEFAELNWLLESTMTFSIIG